MMLSDEDPTQLLEKFKIQFDFDYQYYETNLGSISLTQQWERCLHGRKRRLDYDSR
jgi:hypothetical protein